MQITRGISKQKMQNKFAYSKVQPYNRMYFRMKLHVPRMQCIVVIKLESKVTSYIRLDFILWCTHFWTWWLLGSSCIFIHEFSWKIQAFSRKKQHFSCLLFMQLFSADATIWPNNQSISEKVKFDCLVKSFSWQFKLTVQFSFQARFHLL